MVKPYAYLICEKVIVDQEQGGSPTLVGLFTKITIGIPADAPEIPKNGIAPKDWVVYCSWDIDSTHPAESAVVCTQLYTPDKAAFGDVNRQNLKLEPSKRAQSILRFQGVPVGQAGFYTVTTWLEKDGKKITEPHDLQLEVELSRLAAPRAVTPS